MSRHYRRLLMIMIASVIFTGCGDNMPNASGTGNTVCIFSDRSVPGKRYDFVIRGSECFAQVVDFPGYENRMFFLRSNLPESLLIDIKKWCSAPGEVNPPFPPGGVHFSRTYLANSETSARNVAFFRDDNKQIERFLLDLRRAIVGASYSIKAPPSWVSSDIAIQKELGFETSP